MQRVHLNEIGAEGLMLEEVLDEVTSQGWLQHTTDFAPEGAGRFTVSLKRADKESVIRVRGDVSVPLSTVCARCLGTLSVAVGGPIDVSLFPAGSEPMPDEDGELESHDMGVATYEGDAIDLGEIVHDEVMLQLPMSPLCREACAGLCSGCGANRNVAECECAGPVDPRLAALQGLKLRDTAL